MYNYNMPDSYCYNQNNERFAGGFIGPLLLGGVAGYAIGNSNWNNNIRPMVFYPTPRPYYPMYNPYYYPYNFYRK